MIQTPAKPVSKPVTLEGMRILVTRPKAQASGLAEQITRVGGEPVLFPVIEIEQIEPTAISSTTEQIQRAKIILFVSQNAVEAALLHWSQTLFSPNQIIAAVGRSTARALERHGFRSVLRPTRADSEGLLQLEALQAVDGCEVVIFRGEGGREHLAAELRRRGAQVSYIECYRRRQADSNINALLKSWSRRAIDAVTVTSGETLERLYQMSGALGRVWLSKTALITASQRQSELAYEKGFRQVITASGASDSEMITALLQFAAQRQ